MEDVDEVADVGIAGSADPARVAHGAVVAVGGDQVQGADGARLAPVAGGDRRGNAVGVLLEAGHLEAVVQIG